MIYRGVWTACFVGAGIIWGAAVIAGFSIVERHGATPGAGGDVLGRWPEGVRVARDRGRATLVLLAHPRCPCTRATLAELGRIMARCQGVVTVHVLFVGPGEAEQGWAETDLWHAAEAIPGVRVHADPGGVHAARFGAATSGHVILYDAAGALLYSGGITGSRGHEGDNPGRDAVIALLTRGQADRARMPVFGCPLFDAATDTDDFSEGS